jgi:Mg2+ and Co2+ transporter CorA
MNVQGLPMASGLYGFMTVAVLIIVFFLIPLFYFRYRGWL